MILNNLEKISKDLSEQAFSNKLNCFIVFGSSVVNYNMGKTPGDVDICVVVNDRSVDLKEISKFIFSNFNNPDFRIYFKDEIDSNLKFMDKGVGVFAMEYFANGISLHGENIFIEKKRFLTKHELKNSYLNKIFEYIIRIREAYFSERHTQEYKIWHTYKYVIRLCIDILLYNNYILYSDLNKLKKHDIIDLCIKKGIISKNTEIDFDDLDKMYNLFNEINFYVVKYHTDGFKNKITKLIKTILSKRNKH